MSWDAFDKTVLKNNFDVRSGVLAVIDDEIEMKLNEYGEYETTKKGHRKSAQDPEKFSAMSDKSLNEDDIAKRLFSGIKHIKNEPIIGYYLGLYAGHVTEGDYRKNASSGGMTTWILKELMERKLIDGVIHVQKSKKGDTLFSYGVSRTVNQIKENAKTRYYPVELSSSLAKIKKMKGRFAIVGIPSIVMEVRLLAEEDPEIKDKIAYTVGLICGHQKSTKYAESLAWESGIKPGNLESIDFRKKISGTPANKYTTEMVGLVNGKKVKITKKQEELLVTHWGYGFFKTKFSDFTDDTLNETSDLSVGDAWLPRYTKDSGGDNILIVRNPVIQTIIDEGIKAGKIKIDKLSTAEIIKSQSGLVHHTRDELPYRLKKYDEAGKWRPTKRIEAGDIAFLRKKVQDIREKISEQSHIHYKKAVELDDWSYFENKMKPLVRNYKLLYVMIQVQRNGIGWLIKKFIPSKSEID